MPQPRLFPGAAASRASGADSVNLRFHGAPLKLTADNLPRQLADGLLPVYLISGDEPLLAGAEMAAGEYELVFFVGDYFASKAGTQGNVRFLDRVPVRFGIADAGASYHVPLLCSPWAYSTYRGS